MKKEDEIKRVLWFSTANQSSEIIISNRIRLARNIAGLPFPQWASEEQLNSVGEIVKNAINDSPYLSELLTFSKMENLSSLEKKALSEEHVVSPQFTESPKGTFLATSKDRSIGIMVNEEDHIRVQVISSFQNLDQIWNTANKIDDELGKKINFAFSEKWGYLTACPTNVGTALRVSSMLHLPALVMTQQLSSIFQMISQVGAMVRGLFGEGTHAVGNFYQISNGTTLGRTEKEIVEHLKNIGLQIAEKERSTRKVLYSEGKERLSDSSHRAFGILKYAKLMSFDEAMELLSMLRLGIDLKLISSVEINDINRLMIEIRSAHLSLTKGDHLNAKEEEQARTDLIRSFFNNKEEN